VSVVIPARLSGPPGNANGGVIAATVAGPGPAEVTIRRPVPVETELAIRDGRLLDPAGAVLAEARPLPAGEAAALAAEGEALGPVTIDEAQAAGKRSPLAAGHPFPGCYGCGPDNPEGLHCLAGPVGREGLSAVAFTPPDDSPETVWAALDCPSSAPHMAEAPGVPHVLGRIAGVHLAPLTAGEPHLVVSRATGADGRRRFSVSAIRAADGRTLAVARATWVALLPSGG
jgi:hypothetical protein